MARKEKLSKEQQAVLKEKNERFRQLPVAMQQALLSAAATRGKRVHPMDCMERVMVKATAKEKPTVPGDYW